MVAQPRLSTFEEFETELNRWLERLRLVDELLEKPATTVIPTTVGREPGRAGSLLLVAACCSTVQRLSQRERRFPWLKRNDLRALASMLHGPFIALDKASRGKKADGTPAPCDPAKLYQLFRNEPLPPASPLTSAEIFWVLIKAGEKYAHGAIGFFCILNILWSLAAQRDDHLAEHTADPRDRPSASVVSKCVLPVRMLCDILHKRAKLYRAINDLLKDIDGHCLGGSQRDRWLFVSGLERLASLLHDFASVSTSPAHYIEYSNRITAMADSFTADLPKSFKRSWAVVGGYIRSLLGESHTQNNKILRSAREFMDGLKGVADEKDGAKARELLKAIVGRVDFERADDEWSHRLKAFCQAYETCREALSLLEKGVETAEPFKAVAADPPIDDLSKALDVLREINEGIAKIIETAIEANTHIMRRIITREVASASAGDRTNFDAAELVAALVTVERWLRLSELEVDDALKWSVSGAHTDGSWTTRHPIALDAVSATQWPGTSQIIWMLTMAIEKKSRLRTADDALYAYLQWLDRLRIDLRLDDGLKSGWPSEARGPEVIDVAATMSAVNALLSIHDLIEERLWEICRKRFVVKDQKKSLMDIDPVDLGARHERRLHRRLMRMARETSGDDYMNAEYSLVLHGPPGSSKTAIAEALAGDMWRHSREHRLVRVTPADFTRQGESRLDSEARFIFELLSHIRGATIVFDEIDDLLKKRDPSLPMSFLRLVVPAMLNRLQDLRDAAPRQEICFLFATNYIDAIETALTRPGRFDATVAVPYPDAWSRENILQRNLEEARKEYPGREVLIDRAQQPELISKTTGWPWSTFNKMSKELATKPAGTAKDIIVQITRHLEAVDDEVAYYQRRERWKDVSRPLENEMLEAMCALSDLGTAKKRLTEIAERVPKSVLWLHDTTKRDERLEHVWRRDARPLQWEPRPPRLRRQIKGSGDARMGVVQDDKGTTFRVWAPFAVQVALVNNRVGEWKTPLEMHKLRDLPGVWELTIEKQGGQVKGAEDPWQYRYRITSSELADQSYRSDPYGREWIPAPGIDALNSVVMPSSEAVKRKAAPDLSRLSVCRVCPVRLSGEDRAFSNAETLLAQIRDLHFTAVEVGPRCRDDCDDSRWGYTPGLPYAISSEFGGTAALRDFVELAKGEMRLEVILRTAWGFGDPEDTNNPFWQFDGWRAEAYRGGIYFRSDGKSLDLDEPHVCNLVFDHAVECVETLGVAGVHMVFAEKTVESLPAQATGFAQDLARRFKELKAIAWIDGVAPFPADGPGPLIEVDVRAMLAVDEETREALFEKIIASPGPYAVVVEPLLDAWASSMAVVAFAAPVIPFVSWHDDTPQEGKKLLEKLNKRRMQGWTSRSAKVELVSTGVPDVIAFTIGETRPERLVVVNRSDGERAAIFSLGGVWAFDIDSFGAEGSDPPEILSTKDGKFEVALPPVTARVFKRV